MKKSLLLTMFLFYIYFVANAQNTPKDAATKITESKRIAATEISIKKIDSNSLFILDGKIYNFNSIEFKKIAIDSLRMVKEIKDPSYKTDIKAIFFFERKRN